MSRKSVAVAAVVARFEHQELDPHFLGYLDLFNRRLFFEAHEVLEPLWLAQRGRPEGAFYKGLIQLAGAFVHVGHRRFGPAAALLRLARNNLANYAPACDRLNLEAIQQSITVWLASLGLPGISPDGLPSFPVLQMDARNTRVA